MLQRSGRSLIVSSLTVDLVNGVWVDRLVISTVGLVDEDWVDWLAISTVG